MDGTSLSNRPGHWRLVERTIPHPLWTGRGLPDPHAVKPLGVGRCQAFAWHRLLTVWTPCDPKRISATHKRLKSGTRAGQRHNVAVGGTVVQLAAMLHL